METASELAEGDRPMAPMGRTEDHHAVIREILATQRGYQDEAKGISATLNHLSITVSRVEVQVQSLLSQQAAFANYAERLQRLETRLDEAEKRQVASRWLIGLVTTLLVSLMALAAAHLQWR